MNKSELADGLAELTGMTKIAAIQVVNILFDVEMGLITTAIKGGDKVSLQGFGTFEVATRSERAGFNPATKEKITIPAKNVVKFSAGKNLKAAVAA